jgi:hypothetical protein
MKNELLTALTVGMMLLCSSPKLNAQNQIWALPDNKLVFNDLDVEHEPLPTPDHYPEMSGVDYEDLYYAGDVAIQGHNSMSNAAGQLLFFIVDDIIYDGEGYFIIRLALNGAPVMGNAEVTIVPDPGNCLRYYIFSSTGGFFAKPCYTILDLSLINETFYPYHIRYGAVAPFNNYSQGSNNFIPLSSLNFLEGDGEVLDPGSHFNVHYAATERMLDNEIGNYHLVFIQRAGSIYTMLIDESGIQLINDQLPMQASLMLSPPVDSQGFIDRRELEVIRLVNGNLRLGMIISGNTSLPNGNSISRIVVSLDLDAFGVYIPNSIMSHILPTNPGYPNGGVTPEVYGLEFSPNGQYLYFAHVINYFNPNPIEYFDIANETVNVLNVSNASTLTHSQIEVAKNGRLYFAHANGLASLADANDPTSSWVFNSVEFTYTPSNSGYPNQPAGIVYLLPDQLDGMDYSLFNTYDYFQYTASTTAIWQEDGNPFGVSSDVVRIENELRIPAGVHIIIKNMRFEFFENARCIIEAGASLTLDGTTFTVGPCDALMWHGIEVWGNPTLPQTPTSNQGFLAMRNGSVVEHARTGAIMAKKTFNMFGGAGYSTSHYGGFVHTANSTFRNNEKDVVIKSYVNGNVPNRCRFTNTHFLTDGLLNHPNIFPAYHAELEKVQGVLFTNCSFLNTASFQDHSITKRGIGINASYATFKVIGNNQPFTGDLEAAHQSFYQLYMGIRTWGGESHPFMASKMDFQMNQTGILAVGVCFESIIYNKFTVPENLNDYIDFPIGCSLIGSYLFTLEENEFVSEDSEWNVNYGLIVANSSKTAPFLSHDQPDVTFNGDDVENEVYRNNFNNLKYGITVLGDNRGQSANTGLQTRCNIFVNCESDIYLASDDFFKSPAWRDDQGSNNSVSELTNNVFSFPNFECTSGVRDLRIAQAPDPYRYGDYYVSSNQTLTFQYFSLSQSETSPVDCDNDHLDIQNFAYPNTLFSFTTHCPSNFGSPGPVGPMQVQLAEARSNLETAIGLYEITVDGGEKEDILQALAAAHSYESQFLRNMLLERYPLSHEVLMAALARASSFDPWHLTQVLVANAKLSNDIMNFLEDNEVLSPFFMQFIYDANASGSNSLRAILKSEISYRSYDKSRLERKINRHYLDADSLDASGWNDFTAGQTADYYLMYRIGDKLQKGNINKAIELKDSLTATHPDMLDWLDFRFDLATADSIDATHISTAWDFYNNSPAVLADAMAWLTVQGMLDTVPTPPVHVGEPRSLSTSKPSKKSNKRNFLEAWPNPATDRVMLTYPNEADGMGIIQIFNQQGVMIHQVAAQGKGIAEINTTQWPAGIYIALLKVEDKVFDEVKISVVK